MPSSRSAWGIEVGSYALKALRLERSGDEVRVADYAYIPHRKVLSTPDVDADEIVRLAIGQFMSQPRDLDSSSVLVSVPGNAAFARFAKLPPVEKKRIPDIVKFEAVQQIPFPIEEVEWDYADFQRDDLPDVEVGIFAITKGSVQARLALYGELGLYPDGISLSPVAAYNAVAYDLQLGNDAPGVIILDIGTTSSDLIVAEQGRAWIRTFPIGGHNFTEALIESFKLTYSKAEKLKAEAQTSKYRRQILSAMRPVFADLAQEVQRSIGYYQSLHREANLTKLVGVGSTFKLPGLRKFLSQQLQMEVARLDEYQRLGKEGRVDAKFEENAVGFATAYGLALQGLELAPVDVNLIPVPVVRERLWDQKIKWFGAAAALVVVGSLALFIRPITDARYRTQPADYERPISRALTTARELQTEFNQITEQTQVDARPQNIRQILDYRDVWAYLTQDVSSVLASANPQPELMSGDPEAVAAIPAGERRILELRSLQSTFVPPTGGEGGTSTPRLKMTMVVETPRDNAIGFVNETAIAWLRQHAQREGVPYRIVQEGEQRPHLTNVVPMTVPGGGESAAGGETGVRNPWMGRGGGGPEGMSSGGPEMIRGKGAPTDFPEFGRGGVGTAGQFSDINSIAPLPQPAPWLPPGSKYHQITVVWEVELLPPDQLHGQTNDDNGQADEEADA